MTRKDKRKIFLNPWVIAIGSTAIGTIIASIIINTNLFFEALKIIWKYFKIIGGVFTIPVTLPVWALIITILSIPIIILVIVLLTPRKKEVGPSFKDYKKDTFDGLVFRWVWEYSKYDKHYHIENIAAFCPICDCQLNFRYEGTFVCPSCDFRKSDISKSSDDIKLLIQHQVRIRYFQGQ